MFVGSSSGAAAEMRAAAGSVLSATAGTSLAGAGAAAAAGAGTARIANSVKIPGMVASAVVVGEGEDSAAIVSMVTLSEVVAEVVSSVAGAVSPAARAAEGSAGIVIAGTAQPARSGSRCTGTAAASPGSRIRHTRYSRSRRSYSVPGPGPRLSRA